MTTAASSIKHRETRWARAIDRSAKGLEVRHLRMFLAEVDKAGIADDARVRVTDKLQGSSTFHDIELECRVETELEDPGLYPANELMDVDRPREACGAVDPDEGACIRELGHAPGDCWYSMTGKPRS